MYKYCMYCIYLCLHSKLCLHVYIKATRAQFTSLTGFLITLQVKLNRGLNHKTCHLSYKIAVLSTRAFCNAWHCLDIPSPFPDYVHLQL